MDRYRFDQQFSGPVLGMDEVGVGPIAGPVTVCGVVLPEDPSLIQFLQAQNARDSKQLSESQRMLIASTLKDYFVWHYIVQAPPSAWKKGQTTRILDSLFRKVLLEAMRCVEFETVIVDGSQSRDLAGHRYEAIKQADDKSLTVACASILAKAHTDAYWLGMDAQFPRYGWRTNHGYGVETHIKAIEKHGYVRGVHRENVEPLRGLIASRPELPWVASDDASWPEIRMRSSSEGGRRRLARSGRGRRQPPGGSS